MMNGYRLLKLACLGALLLAALGCVYPISSELRQAARKDLTLARVSENPDAWRGALVLWGGVILQNDSSTTGTELIVLQFPLDWRGQPKTWQDSQGRFIITTPQFLEPETFRRGRQVVVAGEIAGSLTQPVRDTLYPYPVLASRQIYLWPPQPVYSYYYWPYWYNYGPQWYGYPPYQYWYGYAPDFYGWNTNHHPFGGYDDFYGPYGYYDDWWDPRPYYRWDRDDDRGGRNWQDDRAYRNGRPPESGKNQDDHGEPGAGGGRGPSGQGGRR